MTKYYTSDYTVYKVEDNGEKYVYCKSSDSWKPTKTDVEKIASVNESIWYEPNMTEELLEHFKKYSNL